jgi:protein TonB
MVEDAALTAEPAGDAPSAVETPPAAGEPAPAAVAEAPPETPADAASESAEGGTLIGALNADQRIRTFAEQNERTLWASAVGVTLLYAAIIVGQVVSGGGAFSAAEREAMERRGQDAQSISVELVPDPDKTSKTEKWRDGQQSPSPAPPQPEQTASRPQPEVQAPPTEAEPDEAQPTKSEDKEAKEEKQGGQPTLPDLQAMVDAAADNLTAQIKQHYEKKPQQAQPERQAMYSGGGMQVRGTGASGKSDAFSKSVIAALMKTRPGPFALWGRVLVSFQITQQGDLLYVHLLHSSGNAAMDQAAIDAIHKARFEVPPPGLSPDARTYIIDYIFG